MDPLQLASFSVISLIIALTPGPSTLLVLSYAVTGDRKGPVNLMVGAFIANCLMIVLTVLGVHTLISVSQIAFETLRWLGAGYLIYLGISYWRTPADRLVVKKTSPKTNLKIASQAFLTSVTNPKAFLFYYAFLPQFVDHGQNVERQLAIFGALHTAIFIIVLAAYALLGNKASAFVQNSKWMRLRNRFVGGILMMAGMLMLRGNRT